MNIFQNILDIFKNFTWVNGLEIILYFVFICFALVVLKTNNAKRVIFYYMFLTIASGVVLVMVKKGNPSFNGTLLILGSQMLFIVAVTVLFATEIKRAIWTKRSFDSRHGTSQINRNDANTCIEEIIKAVQNMSKNDIGAIIILSNGNLPNGVLESGVSLDADISAQLIESVFFPKSALHDGAMVLYGTKIQSAGCFLPLAQETNLSKEIGSRHRAGMGLTEAVNVTAIIVSEETGIISVAKNGKLSRYIDTNTLRETLKLFYWQDLID